MLSVANPFNQEYYPGAFYLAGIGELLVFTDFYIFQEKRKIIKQKQ